MQSAYTFYILGLNLILAGFSDQAVTALGLYYKWQTFFFIPLSAMQTCIVPIVSFNYAARKIHRCKETLIIAILFGMALMAVGTLCFETIPGPMLRVFTSDGQVVEIGQIGFRFIGVSFIPMVTSLVFPVFFQAVGAALKSSLLTVVRTVVLFVPLGAFFSRFGLTWFWLTFPVTETLTSLLGVWFYRQFLAHPYVVNAPLADREHPAAVLQPSRPGVILTIARQHGSSGKEIGHQLARRLGIPFYYKEMTALAAQESGLDQEFVSQINKNAPRVLYSLYLSTRVVRLAFQQCAAGKSGYRRAGRYHQRRDGGKFQHGHPDGGRAHRRGSPCHSGCCHDGVSAGGKVCAWQHRVSSSGRHRDTHRALQCLERAQDCSGRRCGRPFPGQHDCLPDGAVQ